MSQRFFTYTDAKSAKFWNIALEERNHTVSFGRLGTAGQTQTKAFETEEEALRSFEKLIREKVKKGYVEEVGEVEGAAGAGEAREARRAEGEVEMSPAQRSDTQDVVLQKEAIVPATEFTTTADLPYPAPRSLNLSPEDWFWATWRNQTPLQRPEPKPFNLKEAQARLAKVTTGTYGWQWDWSKAAIAISLSREEAHFWLAAMAQTDKDVKPKVLAEKLAAQTFTGDVSFETFCASLFNPVNPNTPHATIAKILSPDICLPLINLFSTAQLIDLCFFLEQQIASASSATWGFQNLHAYLTQGFQKYVLPYLTSAEVAALRQTVEAQLDLNKWSMDYYATQLPTFYLAAYLGCPTLRSLVESWTDDYYNQSGWRHDHYHRPQEIIFGLGSAALVEANIRRLKLSLQSSDRWKDATAYLRAWLAHTKYAALDVVRDSALSITNKKEAETFTKAVAQLVSAPEVAPVMLELMLSSKAPGVARQWLDDHPAQAIVGLVPIAGGRGRLADAAIEVLRSMKRKGYAAYIQTCINHEAADIAAKVQDGVLNVAEKTYIPLDEQTTPEWLKQALTTISISKKKPSWTITPMDLPPIAIGNHRLNDLQMERVLDALRQSKLDSPHTLVLAVKAHADRSSLDLVAWKLFEAWLTEGAPSKENWALMAVGLLGSDTSALKLAPLIRIWPGESQHQRAVLGLECLRSIATDTALMQINGIAQKVKFKGIKQRAQECMEAIAQERHMTREQLEDRIVPDCELDKRGSRLFDFGSRQFHFVLGAALKPLAKDDAGKVKTDLPKPGAKDDPEKAEAAIAHWKLLKKQVSEVIKIQSVRLEQAMVTGRRWQVGEFETLLVQHPLMTHLTQRLVWGGYDASGTLLATFRVTEDQSYADTNDDTFNLADMAHIGIVHPLPLLDALRSTWGEILSDYEIVSPFPQLGRAIYALEPGEATQTELTRFKAAKVPAMSLVGMLEKAGWARGMPQDAGIFVEHTKPFYGANLTAVVQYEGVPVGYMDGWDDQAIETCFFLPGIHSPEMYPDRRGAIALGTVDAIVISEILKDLIAIAAKAT